MSPYFILGMMSKAMTTDSGGGDYGYYGNSSGNMSSTCPEGNQVIWTTFEQCIDTPLQWASFAIGMASIAFWLGVLMPQIVENVKDMRCVSSISAGLLFSWIFGDTTNLVGAFLTKQGLFQVMLGFWFVLTDIILSSQLIYYHLIFKKRERKLTGETESKRLVLAIAGLMCMTVGFSGIQDAIQPQTSMMRSPVGAGRQLLSADSSSSSDGDSLLLGDAFLKTAQEVIGYIFGITSTIAYFMSRSFQIYKNVTQRNVKGLSTITFVMAVMGNLLYGLAIVLYSVELQYTLLHLPWLLGSWGIMFMDCFIVFQIKTYTSPDDEKTLIVEDPNNDNDNDDDNNEVSPLLNNPINGPPSFNAADNDYGTINPDRVIV